MKFAKYLESQSVPEWRKAYINYKALKKRLKAIEKYRRQNEEKEDCRLELVISALENIDPEIQSSPRKYTAPARTQSSTLDNRSTGGQARSLSFASSRWLDRLSKRLNNRQETELGRVSRPTVQVNNLQVASILEEAIKHASEPEQYFFVVLDQDLETISKFYDSKEKEAEAKYEAIEMQVKIVKSFASKISKTNPSGNHDSNDRGLHFGQWFGRSDSVDSALTEISNLPDSIKYTNDQHVSYNVARSRLKMAITEYYRSLELLKSFKILNETGFRKILKKFDKTAGWKASTLYFQKLNQYHWIRSRKIDDLLDDTESLYIKEFAGGHRRKGMNQLRLPERDDHYTPVSWRTGFYLGLTLAFFARVIQLALDPAVRQQLPNMYFSLQMYACFFLPIIFCVGFSVNALVWTRCHINYKFIFEFNPRDNLDYHQFAELPLLLLLLLSMTMYVDFSQALVPVIPSELCPLVFFSMALGIMACPFPIFYYSSRKWFWATLGRILLSYFLPIEFRDFFIADELNSLSYSFWTLTYFFCAYAYQWSNLSANCQVKLFWFTPIVASLPPWWRFLQCLRRYKDSGEKVHLLNALKYITSIAAALLNGYKRMTDSTTIKVAWIISLIINSSYTSAWDIKMDWGILQLNSHHFLLRDDLVFYRWPFLSTSYYDLLGFLIR
ncbi:unnamed protein product [Rhizopus microsporus]